MNIDIKTIENVKKELETLKDDDVLYIDENGKSKYAILPIKHYDELESLSELLEDGNGTKVKIASFDDIQLTYEEYENIKKQIMDAVDKTLKPNPEKLN